MLRLIITLKTHIDLAHKAEDRQIPDLVDVHIIQRPECILIALLKDQCFDLLHQSSFIDLVLHVLHLLIVNTPQHTSLSKSVA